MSFTFQIQQFKEEVIDENQYLEIVSEQLVQKIPKLEYDSWKEDALKNLLKVLDVSVEKADDIVIQDINRNEIYNRIKVNSSTFCSLKDQRGFFTAQKMKFPIKDFFSKCDQICRKLRIWSHLMKKFLTENFIFRKVFDTLTYSVPYIFKIIFYYQLDPPSSCIYGRHTYGVQYGI